MASQSRSSSPSKSRLRHESPLTPSRCPLSKLDVCGVHEPRTWLASASCAVSTGDAPTRTRADAERPVWASFEAVHGPPARKERLSAPSASFQQSAFNSQQRLLMADR